MEAFRFLMNGGYAQIYHDSGTNMVCKSLEKKTKHDQRIAYSTILDTICIASFTGIHGIPSCHRIAEDSKTIRLFMDYQGQTLLKWVGGHDLSQRRAHCVAFITQLAEILLNLFLNGIQHTDLKPSNILVNSHREIYLIDYNCMSIEVVHETSRRWVESIGTWYYCAPEIVFQKSPSATSMVWSLGLLFCTIWYKYPFSRAIKKHSSPKKIPERQHEWCQIFEYMQTHFSRETALVRKDIIKNLPTDSIDFLSRMLAWDPQKRPSLQDVVGFFKKTHSASVVTWTRIEWISNPNTTTHPQERKDFIEHMYHISHVLHRQHYFTHTVVLFDRCHSISEFSAHIKGLACFVLVGYLHNESMLESRAFCDTLPSGCSKTSIASIEEAIMFIGHTLHWKIYQRSIESILLKLGYTTSLFNIKTVLESEQGPYTPKSMAKKLADITSDT